MVICISSCVLLNLVLCRPFDRLQRFAVRATIISVSQCSAVTSFWPCVRPFSSVWPCVRLLRVFGRVFGCYNFWAVCSAVASVGRAFGRFKYCSVLLFSSCLYLYVFLPVSGFTHSFYLSRLLFSSWYLPFCLGMFYLALAYFLGRFIVLFLFLFGSLYAFGFPSQSLRAYFALFWS